jgi:hypothetical protein
MDTKLYGLLGSVYFLQKNVLKSCCYSSRLGLYFACTGLSELKMCGLSYCRCCVRWSKIAEIVRSIPGHLDHVQVMRLVTFLTPRRSSMIEQTPGSSFIRC